MATKLYQTAFTAGEISPSLHARVDLQRFLSALKSCRNFFVRAQGGASNRPGTQYVYTLNADSEAALIPFIRSEEDAYILVLQEEIIQIFRDGAFIDSGTVRTVTDVTCSVAMPGYVAARYTTSVAHGFSLFASVTTTSISHTFNVEVNGTFNIYAMTADTFTVLIPSSAPTGSYTSGGTAESTAVLTTTYQSDEIGFIRYTQSADVITLAHESYYPKEVTRVSATAFTFATISDIITGPFLPTNTTATTMKSSAATGSGVTLTASTSVFTAGHIGSLVILHIEDVSAIPPWEAAKAIVIGNIRSSNGKYYIATNNANTGTVAPHHDSGIELDGAAAVSWEYLHSGYGVARITAQAGTTATADVLSYIPVVHPAVTTEWAFGAWGINYGYPSIVTYFGDRLVFANTPEQPQTQWASKTGDYHNFSFSSPQVDSDAITQTLNTRQTNAIVEMVPLDQLISLTAKSNWASPKRGESWSPETIGFDQQSSVGASNQRAVAIGEGGIFAERFGTRLREMKFAFDRDKFGGSELTVLARHLFEDGVIVDMDYAEYPDGILWIVRSDGVLIGLTYLPEQEVIAFHRHDTEGFFERVCVIPEEGRDAVYFVVRRTINDETVRYLERLANRSDDPLDAFYVDSGLSYDGRNTTATTITASGASYGGGDSVTLTASAALFASTDIGDAIQFGLIHVIITAYTSTTVVVGELQSPLGAALQGVATTEWAFAHDTFSGLGHLEGELVTGLADGNAIDPDDTTTDGIVTGAQIVLAYPAAVVHIGKAYTQELETLTLNVPGGAQIRANAKLVPKVAVVLQETAGLQVSRDGEHFEELTSRSFEFYTEPQDLVTGVVVGYVVDTMDKDSSILLRQPVPKPCTVLAILPTIVVGGDG